MNDKLKKAREQALLAKQKLEEERLKEESKLSRKLLKKWKLVLGISFVIIGLGLLLYSKVTFDRIATEGNNLQVELTKAKDELRKLSSENTVEPKDVRKNKFSATKYGETIAKLQNDKGTNKNYKNDPEWKKQAEEVDKVITSDNFKMGIDWYVGENTYEWKFVTNYEFEADRIPALWLLYDKGSGTLMKYVVANFNGKNNTFTDFVSNDTTAGVSTVGVEGLSKEERINAKPDVNKLNDLEKKITEAQEKVTNGQKTTISEDEAKKLEQYRSEQFQARQQMLNEYTQNQGNGGAKN